LQSSAPQHCTLRVHDAPEERHELLLQSPALQSPGPQQSLDELHDSATALHELPLFDTTMHPLSANSAMPARIDSSPCDLFIRFLLLESKRPMSRRHARAWHETFQHRG
jgi:hypothetical protein